MRKSVSIQRIFLPLCVSIVFLGHAVCPAGFELALTSDPVLKPVPDVPLARILELSTNAPSRMSVRVNGGGMWQKAFRGYRTAHSLPLLGFGADQRYEIEITLYDDQGNRLDVPERLVLSTNPLPNDFPPILVLESKPEKMEPGYTLFRARNRSGGMDYTVIVDKAGDVVWYSTRGGNDIRQLSNGNLFFSAFPGSSTIEEINMVGEPIRIWHMSLTGTEPPEGSVSVDATALHHEVFPTQHGTILTLISEYRVVENYPTSETDPNAPRVTAEVIDDPVIEISRATGQVLNKWSLIDMLDPRRIGYGSVGTSNDWGHANGAIHDPRDDSVIVSLRHQDAVIKFSRVTGQLKWILAPHENWSPGFQQYLLAPRGTPFDWQYHQHAPMITPRGTLLLFDNGNRRASPFVGTPIANRDNYSRAVEYEIDEQRMEVRQVWEYGSNTSERRYAPALSDADWLSLTDNVLITFGDLRRVDGVATDRRTATIIEVDHNVPPEKVFELSIYDPNAESQGWTVYRSERIPDLYPRESCSGDLDGDRDVDGSDLKELVSDSGLMPLADFASDFGEHECP